MNLDSALGTAILRAVYAALIAGALTALTSAQTGAGNRDALLTGAIAALTVLAMRGGLEGIFDQHRAAINDQQPGDVGFDQLAESR